MRLRTDCQLLATCCLLPGLPLFALRLSYAPDIIHEAVHNALKTTDRAYANRREFSELTPSGTGILSVTQEIPIFGAGFRLIPGNDTLFNPDCYALFARDL